MLAMPLFTVLPAARASAQMAAQTAPATAAAPADADWAKTVLLIVVWMFVLAAIVGPLELWVTQRRQPTRNRRTPGW